MTQYTPDEAGLEWEFKIVRANLRQFHKPETLQRVVEEEARAGWVLLEKFDDSRLRFKRLRSARAQDAQLPADVDPYRSYYGLSPTYYTLLVVGITLAVTLLVMGIIIWLAAVLG